MPRPPLVVVGASAGGVEALREFVGGLPPALPAAVLVVLHIPPSGFSALPSILDRSGPLPAATAVNGEPLLPGRIYVAPPDHHLLVLDGLMRLSRGPAENGHRPAVDPLFRSAARAARQCAIAVMLSGSRDDGTAGAVAVAGRGGHVFVQDPDDALYRSMPASVLDHVPGARALPARDLGRAVARAVADAWAAADARNCSDSAGGDGDEMAALETAMAGLDEITVEGLPAEPAGFACPSCHGALFAIPGEPQPRYRCRVGHAWSAETLLDEQSAAFEGALWMALRALEEKATLARQMQAAQNARPGTVNGRFERLATDAQQAAQLIRRLIDQLGAAGEPVEPEAGPVR